MKTSLGLVACALLACLWMGGSSPRTVEAVTKNTKGVRQEDKLAVSLARQGWQVGSPVSFEKLTIFPVTSTQSVSTQEFITLDEGLRSGKVVITEIGANGRTRRLRRGQRASDNADVNRLMLTNRTGKTLVLIAGEIVLGGNQDRIVGHDCIVASSNVPVIIDVFCVEHGRWHENQPFGQSNSVREDVVTRGGGGPYVAGGVAGRVAGGTPGGVAGGVPGGFTASRALAAPKIREKAQASKDQGEVWEEVANKERENKTSSATGTLNAVYENKEVSTKIDAYEHALKDKVAGDQVVGIVVAINGTVISADVFAAPPLFRAYWPKLLRSYGLEAISAEKSDDKSASATDAEKFLASAEGAKASTGRKRLYRLAEQQTEEVASFELNYTRKKSPVLVHFNRVNKR